MDDINTPEHLWGHDHNSAMGKVNNKILMCTNEASLGSRGIWLHQNPLHFSTPILLLQLSISSITSMFFDFLLRPLGQTTTVSHFLVIMPFINMYYKDSVNILYYALASVRKDQSIIYFVNLIIYICTYITPARVVYYLALHF